MDDPQDREREQSHLAGLLALIEARLEKAKKELKRQQSDLTDIRRDEFQERSEPLLRNLWAAHRFEDLVHLSQEFQNAAAEEQDHETTLRLMSALRAMRSSPYFARIDLQFEEDEPAETIYIGRRSLWDDQKENLLIYDWRSPIASVFYRFGAGPAFYQAPAGKISCRLLLKRQFEIQEGRLIGYFDADTVIQDSFLRRLLAQNASPQMKAIVETLQRDQDAAIRDEEHELLMVQGVAGSGKTSIAMHRVAYLMYEGLKNPLKPHHILILSPNTVFEKYISSVLPELGESNVVTTTLEQLLEETLGCPVETRADRWEALYGPDPEIARRRSLSMRLLAFPDFITLLDRFLTEIPRSLLPYEDLCYAGQQLISREEIKAEAADKSSSFPLAVRLDRLESRLWERVHALRPARMDQLRMMAFRLGRGEEYARGCSIWESGVLARRMRRVTRIDVAALYRRLWADRALLRRMSRGLSLPEALLDPPLPADPSAPVPLEHAAAMAYLHMKLHFQGVPGEIRQVVVDEAQDYSPLDFAVLRLLFPRARFTVVGDVNQAIEQQITGDFYANVHRMLGAKSAEYMELRKSFRCTREILNFSLQFLDGPQVDSLNRSGSRPRLLSPEEIGGEIAACRAQGYESIALITKTAADAAAWREKLPAAWNVRQMGYHARVGDAFLVPLPLSKGLEFDAVILLDCDEAHYSSNSDKRLLYVACTRALHRLALVRGDNLTHLVYGEEEQHA